MGRILRAGPALLLPKKFKPAGIPKIDWSNPLTHKLVAYWWDLGLAGRYIDLISGHTTVLDTGAAGNPSLGTSQYGTGTSFINNTISTHDPALYPVQTWAAPYAVACGFYQIGSPNVLSTPGYFGVADTVSNDAFMFYNDTSISFGCSLGNSATSYQFAFSNNTFYVAVSSATGASASSSWVNGVAQTAGTTATGITGSGLGVTFGSSAYNSPVTASPNAIVFFGAIWYGRTLDVEDAKLLYNDPYCFLTWPEGEMPALFTAGAAAGFMNAGQQLIFM